MTIASLHNRGIVLFSRLYASKLAALHVSIAVQLVSDSLFTLSVVCLASLSLFCLSLIRPLALFCLGRFSIILLTPPHSPPSTLLL